MAIYQKNYFVDDEVLYADQLNSMEDGISENRNLADESIKLAQLASERNADSPKNIFDYHPILEEDLFGGVGTYNKEDNSVSCTASHLYNLFGNKPYPIVFNANKYYSFSGYIKHNGGLDEGIGLDLTWEFSDGYTMHSYFNDVTNEYTRFEVRCDPGEEHTVYERGGLRNIYFGYGGDGATIWTFKDVQMEIGIESTDYEKADYVKTAIDYVARKDIEEIKNSGIPSVQPKWTYLKTIVTTESSNKITVIDYQDRVHYRNIRALVTFPAATATSVVGVDVRHVGASDFQKCMVSTANGLTTEQSTILFEVYDDDGLLINKIIGNQTGFYVYSNPKYIKEFSEDDYFDNITLNTYSAVNFPAGTVIKLYTK